MRKIIAHILVVVLVISGLGDLSIIHAAENPDFYMYDKDLFVEGDGVTNSNYKQIQYTYAGTGKYTFDYFIEDSGEDGTPDPWQVKLEFDKTSDSVTGVKISAKNSLGAQNETFLVRKVTDNKWGDQVKYIHDGTTVEDDPNATEEVLKEIAGMGKVVEATDGTQKFHKILNSNKTEDSLGFNDTQMYIELSDIKVLNKDEKVENLVIKVKLEGDKISFSTNGLKKGLVTCFRLTKGENGTPIPQYVFPGVAGLSIAPQHFVKDGTSGVQSAVTIPDDLGDEEEKIRPGERPGILVSYNTVKKIQIDNNNNTFKFEVDSNQEYDTKIRLNSNMLLEYTSTATSGKSKVAYTGSDNIRKEVAQALEQTNDKVMVRLANPEVIKLLAEEGASDAPNIIVPWEELEFSQLLQKIEIGITMKDSSGTNEEYTFSETHESMAKYTYLKYDIGQTVDKQIHINLNPYKTKNNIEYYIFVEEEKNSLREGNLSFDKSSQQTGQVLYQKKITTNGNDGQMKIEIAGENGKYIRVVAVIEEKYYCYSQILKIDVSKLTAEPEIPTGLKVSNIVVTPSKSEETKEIPTSVKVDLEWNAPNNLKDAYLNNGELYYELILRDITDEEDESIVPGTSPKAAYSKIYKVSKDGSKLQAIQSTDIEGNNVDGKFTVKDVYLKREKDENNNATQNWIQLMVDGDNMEKHWKEPYEEFYTEVKEGSTLEDKHTGRVYYLSLRAVYVPDATGSKPLSTVESSLVPLPVDFTKNVISVVESVEYDKTKEEFNEQGNVKGQIGFDHIDISHYVDTMLEPSGLKLSEEDDKKYSGKYEFYFYKKGTEFNKDNAKYIGEFSAANNKIDIEKHSSILEDGIIKWDYAIDELLGKQNNNEYDEIIQFDNLMTNQAYMLKVRVKLEPIGEEARYSEFSREFSFTTTTQANSPGTDERKPPVPGEIRIEAVEGSNSSAKVIWDKANFVKDDDMEVYYEVIRSTVDIRKELTNEQLKGSVEKIVGSNNRMLGFSTIDLSGKLDQEAKYMTFENGKWSILTPEQVVPQYTYNEILEKDQVEEYSFIDDKLAPNNIYYYYVRTVCVIKDGDSYTTVSAYPTIKSEWIAATITTSGITPPENLKIEKAANYAHDTKHEAVISFEAEIPANSDIPDDFMFEVGIKEDEASDYTVIKLNRTPLDTKATDRTGWTRYVYKISDLKSNTRYSIKVRIVDKTTEIADTAGLEQNETYAKSFYSEIITIRTDYDEDDEKDKEAYKEYLKKLEAEIDKIKSRPYWKLEDSGEYKYRTEYIKVDLASQQSYTLVNEDKDYSTKYYLPAEVINCANENNTLIEIELDNVKTTIRANTLLEDQAEIREALEAIQRSDISDYYIVIETSIKNDQLEIAGEKSISPKIYFELSLDYMKETDEDIEIDILEALDKIVTTEKKSFIKDLEKELEAKKLSTAVLDELVEDSIMEIEEKLSKQVSKIITKADKRTYKMSSVNKPILITYQTEDVLGNAYYQSNNWVKVPCISNGNEIMIEIEAWGWYIITGMRDLIETVPSLAPYQSFISKYGLNEIFQIDAYMIKTAATNQQVYGALAKVLGAPSNTDYATYLQSKGIKGVTKLRINSNIRQDEAIYLIMQGYEQIHHQKVQTIKINNKQSVQNIGAFQSIYRDYVYAAVKLNIVIPTDNKVYPSAELTVEKVIKMLYDIQK